MPTPIDRNQITGVVLAGGRGTRMGGVDKGLQPYRGTPLIEHALARLAPQVGALLISANRNLDRYARFGVPVLSDTGMHQDAFDGPLAGILAALRAAPTPYLAVVPCDTPWLPLDLVPQLASAFIHDPPPGIAFAATVRQQTVHPHPVCALIDCALADDLALRLAAGERRVMTWYARHNAREVRFGDDRAFYNANTLQALINLEP